MLAKGTRSIVWIGFGFGIIEQKQKGAIRSLCYFLKLICFGRVLRSLCSLSPPWVRSFLVCTFPEGWVCLAILDCLGWALLSFLGSHWGRLVLVPGLTYFFKGLLFPSFIRRPLWFYFDPPSCSPTPISVTGSLELSWWLVAVCRNRGNAGLGGSSVTSPVESPWSLGDRTGSLTFCSELKYFGIPLKWERNFWGNKSCWGHKVLRRQALPALFPGGKNIAKIEGHCLNQFS